jgi:uncharacterized protein
MINKTTISQIVRKIATTIKPEKIFLFGSYATGQATEDSDVDLLIIKNTSEPKYKRSIEIQKLLIGSKIPVDIIVYTNDEYEKEKSDKFSFVNTATQGAKLMYER